MTNKPKSVADMTAEEYLDYLRGLDDKEFMKVVSHDVKKVVSIVHGYLSLIRLDIQEDAISATQLDSYVQEMEQMLMKSYTYMDAAEDAFKDRIG